ncbi:MAG: crotonase/enoyl-CoA hydratase family protein [Candidatus Dormibacteria bacterium]
MSTVVVERDPPVVDIAIDRPEARNAIDGETAAALLAAFTHFDADDSCAVAVLRGNGGVFCAGADLRALDTLRVAEDGDGPLGITRLQLSKPVIAAVEGQAVAGGLELALWCDIRIAAHSAVFGVFSRRFGVPLVDGGTVRLPRIIGHGRALEMILSGRPVAAAEALSMGLVSAVVADGTAAAAATAMARDLARFPQTALRNDRRSVCEQWSLPTDLALRNEARLGREVIDSGETAAGAARFAGGEGRHGGRLG